MANKTKIVKEFLDKVKAEKIEQLLGITMDVLYWKSIIGKVDVDNLRTQMGNERAKGKNKSDLKIIESLSTQITNHEKAVTELVRLGNMRTAIEVYMKFIMEPDGDALRALEEVADL